MSSFKPLKSTNLCPLVKTAQFAKCCIAAIIRISSLGNFNDKQGHCAGFVALHNGLHGVRY